VNAPSIIVAAAAAHQRQREAYNATDAAFTASNSADHGALAAAWQGVATTAAVIMRLQPADELDLALTIGLANSWIDVLFEQVEGTSFTTPLMAGIRAALGHATLRLLDAPVCMGVLSPVAELTDDLRKDAQISDHSAREGEWEQALATYAVAHGAATQPGLSEDEVTTLSSLDNDAFRAMVGTPAPDLAALQVKMEIGLSDVWSQCHAEPEEVAALLADVTRLTGRSAA
jgi:hypothetical protein